jgi:hypothetical protein
MLNDDPPPSETPPTPESPRRFRDETLLVLLTVVAVAGIALINVPHETRPATPELCADCGEVIGIHESGSVESGQAATGSDARVDIDVRMLDGSLRTIKQSARSFDIGDHVRVNGNALSSRS